MQRRSLYFESPGNISIRESRMPSPEAGEVLVDAIVSGISAGTEMLAYRGEFPSGVNADASFPEFSRPFSYPSQYGYTLVGRIRALGAGVDPALLDRRVFCFHPHESSFCVAADKVILLDEDLEDEDWVFTAAAETAVSIVHDTLPQLGENGVVFGLGTIGLMTARLLSRFPLNSLLLWDPLATRRDRAASALESLPFVKIGDPGANVPPRRAADFAVECSGTPSGFNMAIESLGMEGRLVVASWYGSKAVAVDLGGWFHQGRLALRSSQVSSIPGFMSPRWSKQRRLQLALSVVREMRPSSLVSHRFPLERAGEAFEMLAKRPVECSQVVLNY